MNNQPDPEDRLALILQRAVSMRPPSVGRSAIASLATNGLPPLPESGALVIFFSICAASVSCAMIAYFDYLTTTPDKLLGGAVIFASMLFLWYLNYARSQRHRKVMQALTQPLEELDRLSTYLEKWLHDLDMRTSKYFHCVTNSKVTDYFVLSQVNTSLRDKVEQVRGLLARPKRERILTAAQMLQGTLLFHDGIAFGTGTTYIVPMAHLENMINELIENLERGLKTLEEEIDFARQEMPELPTQVPGSNQRNK